MLYTSIGSTCNICAPPAMTAAILRMKPDGTGLETYAEGIRNSVGFAWHPVTHELWFTDNGRDMLGDDVPNDELNVAYKAGLHFGFPFCHQGDVPDPEFGAQRANDFGRLSGRNKAFAGPPEDEAEQVRACLSGGAGFE